jgi:malate dehydrogenase (oxaloacetate-decarboxylating)
MAECNKRPVIFPLSNPTSRAEATPSDIEAWTEGRALIGVGSPFPPIIRDGASFKVDQTNNSYIFSGVGLGALAVGASRVSDGMFMAAARALANSSPARDNPKHNLLPPVGALREVALTVALAVALQAQKEGLAKEARTDQIDQRIRSQGMGPQISALSPRRKTAKCRPGRAKRQSHVTGPAIFNGTGV